MVDPFFSIVIPTHNRAAMVAKTLRELQCQTFEAFECIVVDDGGDDDTCETIEALGDPRFRYVWKEHGERGAARNRGVDEAGGRYVYFLDSDDWLAPDALRRVWTTVQGAFPPVVASRIQYVDPPESIRLAEFPYGPGFRDRLVERNFGGGCVYVRADVADEVRFFEDVRFSIAEDWDYALRLAARHEFAVSPVYDRVVLLHDDNTMKRVSSERILTCADLLENSLSSDPRFMQRYREHLPSILGELTSLAALHAALEGRSLAALGRLGKALYQSPMLTFSRRSVAVVKHIFL